MKKILTICAVVLAIACMTVGFRAATASSPDTTTDLSKVTVTLYQGEKEIISMTGPDCASVYYVLPTNVKERIIQEWDNFTNVAREQGTYAGVKYSFKNDFIASYNGYKVVATNVTSELIHKVLTQ